MIWVIEQQYLLFQLVSQNNNKSGLEVWVECLGDEYLDSVSHRLHQSYHQQIMSNSNEVMQEGIDID